jgi:hypothetical protein
MEMPSSGARDLSSDARGINSLFSSLVDLLIDVRDLFDPNLSLFMFHGQYVVNGPMEVVSNIRYLLVDALQGVADYSPRSVPRSKS